jgi:hypothetical protein
METIKDYRAAHIGMIKCCNNCMYRKKGFNRILCTYGSVRENPEVEKSGLCYKWKSITQI